MIQVIQVNTFIMHEYKDNLFKNILVLFRWKFTVFEKYWGKNEESNNRGLSYT